MGRCVAQTRETLRENGKFDIIYHPITCQSGMLTSSQINWSTRVKEAYSIMMSFHKMAFYLCNAEVVNRSDHTPIPKLIKNKTKNVLTQNRALEVFSIFPYITFQHIKGKDNLLADSPSHLQCLGLYEKSPAEKPSEELSITIFDEAEIIHEHAWPEDFTPLHPDMVTLISDPNHKESVIDKRIFQEGDDLYE